MTNQIKRLPELPPLTIHGLPDEIHKERDHLDRLDRTIQCRQMSILFKPH